jgi:hypothetical protein
MASRKPGPSDVSDFARLIAAEVGQGRSRVKAGHPVPPGESGGYWIAAFAGDDMQVMQLFPDAPLRVQRGPSARSVRPPYRGAAAAGANIGKTEIRLTEGLRHENCAASDGVKP